MAHREQEQQRQPRAAAGMLRAKKAIQRWRVLGEKLADLMLLVNVQGRVRAWLPDYSSRLLGLESPAPAVGPCPTIQRSSSTTEATDKQLEYGEIIKFASYLGVRRSREQPRAKVETCVRPLVELKGGGNQHSKEIYCDLCKARWEYLGPDKLQEKKRQKLQTASASAGTPGSASTGTKQVAKVMCHCQKPAFQWEVKKEGPTKGRHFWRCDRRVCNFFQWDLEEQEKIKRDFQAQRQQAMETEDLEKMNAEIYNFQAQAEAHVEERTQEMKRQFQTAEKGYQDRLEAQEQKHQLEMQKLQEQMAWMQSFMQQVQASQAAQQAGFHMVPDN